VDTATATQAVKRAGFTSLTGMAVFSRLYARNVMEQVKGLMTMAIKNKPPYPKYHVVLELTYRKFYHVRANSQAHAVEICKLRAQKRTKALKNLHMHFVSAKAK
jgi:hypothetical protein